MVAAPGLFRIGDVLGPPSVAREEGSFEMMVFVRGEAHGTFDLAHPS